MKINTGFTLKHLMIIFVVYVLVILMVFAFPVSSNFADDTEVSQILITNPVSPICYELGGLVHHCDKKIKKYTLNSSVNNINFN